MKTKTFIVVILCILSTLVQADDIMQNRKLTDSQWREDLQYMVSEMDRIHPDLFAVRSEEEFMRDVDSLNRSIPGLSDSEILVAIMQLVASIGDGHTMFSPVKEELGFQKIFPVKIARFEDGIFIQAVEKSHAQAVGKRVVRIGNVTAEEAFERIYSVTPHDNKFSAQYRASYFLVVPEILNALKISDLSDSLILELSDDNGETMTESFSLIDMPFAWRPFVRIEGIPSVEFVTARDSAGTPTPLFLRHRDKNYSFDYIEDHNTVYVQYNRVGNQEDETISDFFGRVIKFAEEHKVEKFILDVRYNSGGDGTLNLPIIHGFIRSDWVNQPGRLFTIIGRGTFSAAVMLVGDLERHTKTVFAGEPTASPPNHFGDPQRIYLPNSGAMVRVSKYYWQNARAYDTRTWTSPHVPVELNFEDYRSGRDAALETILSLKNYKPVYALLKESYDNESATSARKKYEEYKQQFPDKWARTTEQELWQLGVDYYNSNDYERSVAVLELLCSEYTDNAEYWGSLGYICTLINKNDRALECIKKALEIDPENSDYKNLYEQLSNQ